MASTTIPPEFSDLLQGNIATLATVGPDGRPQVSAVWFVAEGDVIRISLNESRQKTKNLAANPACTVFLLDLESPMRYLEVRGDARIEPDPDYAFARKVGDKYGADVRSYDPPGVGRVVVTVEPVKVNAVDMRG